MCKSLLHFQTIELRITKNAIENIYLVLSIIDFTKLFSLLPMLSIYMNCIISLHKISEYIYQSQTEIQNMSLIM